MLHKLLNDIDFCLIMKKISDIYSARAEWPITHLELLRFKVKVDEADDSERRQCDLLELPRSFHHGFSGVSHVTNLTFERRRNSRRQIECERVSMAACFHATAFSTSYATHTHAPVIINIISESLTNVFVASLLSGYIIMLVSAWPVPNLRLTGDHFMGKLFHMWQPTTPHTAFHLSGFDKWVVTHVLTWLTWMETIKTADMQLYGLAACKSLWLWAWAAAYAVCQLCFWQQLHWVSIWGNCDAI